jgi:DNA-binding LytR/AlgR family response regulator
MATLKCMVIDDSAVQRAALTELIAKHPNLILVDVFQNGISARASIKRNEVDLIFLDVEMPVVDGFELIESLEIRPQIILITSNPSYALRAFDHNVTDYLLKPITKERFNESVKRALLNYVRTEHVDLDTDFIYVNSDLKKVKVFLKHINWVQGFGDYIKLITEEGNLLVLSTMKAFMALLPQDRFLRIHKSYIVNLDKVEKFNSAFVEIQGHEIPLSKHKKTALEEALMQG